jgi:transposase
MNLCGIDVSAHELVVALRQTSHDLSPESFPNTPAGHRSLLAWLHGRGPAVRITLEATGVYSLDLALGLAQAGGVELAVVNPKLIRRFAESLDERSKDDPLDARVLREYTARMPFRPWRPPSPAQLALRDITRHMLATTEVRTATRNRLHAARSTRSTPACVRSELERTLRQIEASLLRLQRQARALVAQDPTLESPFQLLLTVPGIAELSALQLLAEVGLLGDRNVRQWVSMPAWMCATTARARRSAACPISANAATATCAAPCLCPPWWPRASIPACAASISNCWPAANANARPWPPSCANCCTPSLACSVTSTPTGENCFARLSPRRSDDEIKRGSPAPLQRKKSLAF